MQVLALLEKDQEAWNTPVIVQNINGASELVIATQGSIQSFEPETGKQLWTCATDIGWYMVPSIVAHSMRDALSLLDQAIAHGAGKVDENQVRDMLGTVDLDYLFSILDALLAGDASGMLQVAETMAMRAVSPLMRRFRSWRRC